MIGTELSRYRILKKLGAGGMGDVYLAVDTSLDRNVALKVLPADVVADAHKRRQLESEAKAASALNHPNVAHIYEIGVAGATTFIAMEFVEGVSLAQKLEEGSLSVREIASISLQILSVLEAAHSKGVVHSDLKPANIMIAANNHVKIVDFGLAKLMRIDSPAADDLTWTNAGMIRGTLLYMSPEQALGRLVDHRTDIFSFGIVLFEMLTGRRPFQSGNVSEALDRLLHHEPEPISRFRQDSAVKIEPIVRKCLEKQAAARYSSAAEIARDLTGATLELGKPLPAASRWLGTHIARTAGLVLLLLLAGTAGIFYRTAGVSSRVPVESLAVMPFENKSTEEEMAYLSDGVTEHLINNLSQLRGLRVLGRNSVFRYKGEPIDPVKAGNDLNVDALLTGKVLQRGDTLIIQTELIDTNNGRQLWGRQFNRRAADLFDVQEEISLQISETLKLELTGEERQRITIRHTQNVAAYHEYLNGLSHLNARTGPDIFKAIEFFNASLKKDAGYALPYAGLAYSYALLGSVEYGLLTPRESIPKAKEAAERALALEPQLADAHVVMAFVHLYYDWNWAQAEAEFRRALQLDPSNSTAHHWYAEFLAAMQRFDEAYREIQLAQERDRLSPIINTAEGRIRYLHRQNDAAADQLVKTLARDPDFAMAQIALAFVYGQQEKHEQAESLFKKAIDVTGGAPVARMGTGYIQALAGNRTGAMSVADGLKKQSGAYIPPAYIAAIYAGLGSNDEAFALLEKAYAERSGALVFLKVEPIVDKLRSDIRFRRLLERIGL